MMSKFLAHDVSIVDDFTRHSSVNGTTCRNVCSCNFSTHELYEMLRVFFDSTGLLKDANVRLMLILMIIRLLHFFGGSVVGG